MPNAQIDVIIKATQQGFDVVIKKLEKLQIAMEAINTTAKPANTFSQIEKGIKTLAGTVDTLSQKLEKLSLSFAQGEKSGKSFISKLTMQWTMKSMIHDMEQMIAVQLRWYAVQPIAQVMQTALYAPFQGMKAVGNYIVEIDKARGEMLRWGATTGTVSDKARADIEVILTSMQKATTEFPIAFEELSKTVQDFVSAGIPTDVVQRMIPDIARMKIAFPEIDYKQFSVALTGAYNVFKDTIKGMTDEADAMASIMDKILAAQAKGIIRPEQFTTVLQYMSEIGKLSGFTLDEILGLSIAITDTGIKANSASRLMASLMLTLQGSAGRKNLLEDFKITIDKTLPLGQQFNKLISEIRAKVGTGGAISVGWMGALEKLVGKEQAKDLAALIDQMDRYEKTVKLIEESQGGLVKAAEVAMAPLKDQWLLFTNIVKQAGKELAGSGIEEFFRQVMIQLNDMAQGFLAGADATGIFSDKIDKLGDAGQTVYTVIKTIREEFTRWGEALSPVFKALGFIIEAIDKVAVQTGLLRVALEALITVLAVRFAAWALVNAATGLVMLVGNLLLAAGGITSFGAAISKLLMGTGPLALLIIGITAINELFHQLNKEMDKADARDKAFTNFVQTAKTSDLEKKVASLKATPTHKEEIASELEIANAKEGYAPITKRNARAKAASLLAEDKVVQWQINEAQGELNRRAREEAEGKKPVVKGAPEPADTEGKLKNYGQSEVQSIQKIYGAGIDQVSSDTTKRLHIIDNEYKMGVYKTFEEYSSVKEKILSDSEKSTLWMLNDQEIALKEKFAEIRTTIQNSKATTANKKVELEKIDTQETAILEVIEKKRTEIRNKIKIKESDLDLREFEQKKKDTIRQIEDDYKLKEAEANQEVKLMMSNNKILEASSKDMYDHLKLSATDYYDFLYGNIEKEAAKEKWLVDEVIRLKKEELVAKEAAIAALGKDAAKTPGLTPEDRARLIEQIDLLEKLAGLKKSQIDQKAVEQKSSLDLKGKYDPRKVYEDAKAANARARFIKEAEKSATLGPPTEEEVNKPEEVANNWKLAMDSISDSMAGVSKVGDLALDELASKWLDTAKNIKDMWEGTTQSLADTFESVFVDNMNGELKSLKDYFEAFTKSVLQMLFKIAAQEIALMTITGLKSGVGMLGGLFSGAGAVSGTVAAESGAMVTGVGHKGGVVGPSFGSPRTVSPNVFKGAPKFHKGLAPDEFPAILQKGEAVVPKSKVTKSIVDIILGRTKEKEVTKEKTTTQRTIENIVNLVTKRLSTEKISSDKQSVTELVTSYVEDDELIKAPKYHTGLAPDAALVRKEKPIAPPKSGIDRLLEKTKERISEITATRSTSSIFNTINSSLQKVTDSFSSVLQKDSSDFVSEKTKDNVRYISDTIKEKTQLFDFLKEKDRITSIKERESLSDTVSEKEDVSYISDTLKEKEKESVFARTNNTITTFVQKLSERFSTTLQKESIKDSSDTEKVSKTDTETRNSTIYRDKSALQELTEKVTSVLQKSESIVKDNVVYLSDVVKEKEKVSASTSDSRSVVQKLTDTFTSLNKNTSLTKIFEKVSSITEGIGSIVESTVNNTNINTSNVNSESNVSNNSEGAAAPAGVLSFHKGGLVPKFHLGGLVLPKFHGGGVVIPMFHGGGLNSDERAAVLQTGERVLSREQTVMMDNMYNRVMNVTNNNAKPTNVQVNVINQSSQNVQAEQQSTKFDLEKTVVSIVLKDMSRNGSIYGAVKGVK